MKKLFSFVCALVCALSLNAAKTIYLSLGSIEWNKDGATFKEAVSNQSMTAVDGKSGYYQVTIEDSQTQVTFQRIGSNGTDVWNKQENLTIPDGKDLYTLTGWDNSGTWSVFNAGGEGGEGGDPTPDPATTYYIAGSSATLFGKQWDPAGMALDQQSDGTWSKAFTTCVSGKEYQFKITDGKWDSEGGQNWGFSNLASTPAGVTGNSDNNIVCTTYDANMTVVFNPSTNKITLTGVFTNGEGGDTPDPTASYYMKHPWYGIGWAWKELKDNGDGTYSIRERFGNDNGVYGCNWNTSASDNNSTWVGSPQLVDSPAEGDSAVFTLNPTAEKSITITKIQGAEVVINYVDITIRVKADAAPTIWWRNAGSKCPSAENTKNAEGTNYTWDNQPVMTAVDGLTGWYEWVLKEVNEDSGVTFKINKGSDIVAKESTCYDVNGNILSCPGASALSNIEVENAAVKVIRDGQVLIVREGVTYNLMGQTIQ
ncbi:MAG: hypothetical protein ACI30J_00955 [Paludibacteraceae bacterium]